MTCEACTEFFSQFQCGKSRYGECDCPKCQGYCECHLEDGEEYCSECKQPCQGSFQDFGIGSYEFWGYKGNDVRMCYVSDCCEAEVHMNGAYYEPEPQWEEYEGDDPRLFD